MPSPRLRRRTNGLDSSIGVIYGHGCRINGEKIDGLFPFRRNVFGLPHRRGRCGDAFSGRGTLRTGADCFWVGVFPVGKRVKPAVKQARTQLDGGCVVDLISPARWTAE